jgi:hypothetical protein
VTAQFNHLRIVLSSPSDAIPLRRRITSHIDKISRQTQNGYNVCFDVISSERGIRGGIAAYPQAVIDAQLAECDMYLGVMWTRVGTPTKKFASGTIEEFEVMLDHWKKRRRKKPKRRTDPVEIRFYFLDKARKPSALSPVQIKGVKEFMKRLTQTGVLYKQCATEGEILADIADELHAIAKDRTRPPARKRARKRKAPVSKLASTSADEMGRSVVGRLLRKTRAKSPRGSRKS